MSLNPRGAGWLGGARAPDWLPSSMSTHDFAFEDGDLVMPRG
ncbi:MAG: hypothetical protein RXS42_00525 [Nitrososphaeria archaeon]